MMRFLPLSPAGSSRRAWGLALAHQRIARTVAWRLVRHTPRLRPHVEDLQQEALIGIYRSALTYSPERGTTFTTWAWWWARAFCQRAARRLIHHVGATPVLALEDLHESPSSVPDQELMAEAHLLALKLEKHLARQRALPRGRNHAIAPAPARDAQIFLRRLLFDETLQSIGTSLGGLTRERVRQLEVAVAPHFDTFRTAIAAGG